MDELKEKIARAIAYRKYSTRYDELMHYVRSQFEGQAQAALNAIEEAGYRVVPSDVAEEINHNSNVSNGLIAEKASKGITPDVGASCAVLSDSATSFDPEKTHCKENDL